MQNQKSNQQKRNPAEAIYDKVLLAIFERKLAPGVRLKEEEMCEVFDASRGTVRTVLQRLAIKKLVNIVPNSGAFVAKPDIREAKEVFEARRLIEKNIVLELAKSFNKEKKAILENHVDKEHQAEKAGEEALSIRLSGEFHLLLGELSEKSVLTELLREVIFRTSLIISLYKKQTLPSSLGLQCDHDELIAALSEGDGEKAAELMEIHLLAIESQLKLTDEDDGSAGLRDVFL
ncbi:GntR family transcriptional regulator [Grimontia marina]|uniref:Putative HTH-type transcriptional regulator YdfH n=1 Tax=Grimontia marina TaxID=646534 RepID=A0A128FJH7_9GAMM|nr:GntR family transcriptional regulator [Grimontia marina]CZF86967.1 putative HTH-type transcriptional regulator YdfH [Grimontia marina]